MDIKDRILYEVLYKRKEGDVKIMQGIMKTILTFGLELITSAMAGGPMRRGILQPILNRRNRNTRLIPVLLIGAGIASVIFVLRRGLDIRGLWNQSVQPITNLHTSWKFKKKEEVQQNTEQPLGRAINDLDGMEDIL